MKKIWLNILLTSVSLCVSAQATFNGSGTYSQTFGTSTVSSWTNNSTFTGWYLDNTSNFQGTINITSSAPSNNGGQYMYTCSGGTDMKLGTRPSNGTGGGPCTNAFSSTCGNGVGLRLLNNSGLTITSLRVAFDWYQLSLAENGSNANSMFFGYQTGSSVTSLTSGSWTNVSALDFAAPQSSSTNGTAQISGYPCSQTGSLSNCFVVTISNGNEIMLRWWDPNNSANDPHLAIDNIVVTAYTDNSCLIVLPLELISFSGLITNNQSVDLEWQTASESNLSMFEVQKSTDGSNFSSFAYVLPTNTNSLTRYTFQDNEIASDIIYYRLKINEVSVTTSKYSSIIEIRKNADELLYFSNNHLYLNPRSDAYRNYFLEIRDISGRLCFSKNKISPETAISLSEYGLPPGIYFATLIKENSIVVSKKIIIQ